MKSGRDAFLEVLRTDVGLRFTFLDRARPSLSYEQSLAVPAAMIDGVAARHRAILEVVSNRISRDIRRTACAPASEISVKAAIHNLSEEVRTALFPEDLLAHIRDFAPTSLLIRTNCPQIPWELSRINGDLLGLKLPTGRGLLTQRPLRRVAARKPNRWVRVLMIANPTGDLPGADAERDALTALFEGSPFFEARVLHGAEATLENFAQEWSSGAYDVLHFAGHSTTGDKTHGELLLADGSVGGQYLAKILERNPPEFVFLNSCNSGVVAGSAILFDDLLGLAPNLLRVGVDAVIGTAWPVIDDATVEIATEFYRQVGLGVAVGMALNRARRVVEATDEVPYWLGYALFGDPDLRLRDDDSWKVEAIRSGGRVAAASTFSGRASLHVSSLHSFLISAEHTDTAAIAIACECHRSEALVHGSKIDLGEIAQERDIRIGVPGVTGSAIFARKMARELALPPARCRFIELDTAEVRLALDRGAVDATVLWYPDLSNLDLDRFVPRFSAGDHDYTLCVLVARTPRTTEEKMAAHAAVREFAALGRQLSAAPRRWSQLLADQMGLSAEDVARALPAYDFVLAGHSTADTIPAHVRAFIEREIAFLRGEGLLDPAFPVDQVLLPLDEERDSAAVDAASGLTADIQWSISSIPLLMGKFQGIYS